MAEIDPSHSLESKLHEAVCQTMPKTEQCHQANEKPMNHREAAAEDGCSIEKGKMPEQLGESSSPMPLVGVDVQMHGHSGLTCEPSLKIDSVGSECATNSLVDPMDVLSYCDKSLEASEVVNPRPITEEKSLETCLQGRGDADNGPPLSEGMKGGLDDKHIIVEPLCDSVSIGMSSVISKENDMNGHENLTSEAENPHIMAEYDPPDQTMGYSTLDKIESIAFRKHAKDVVNHYSVQHNNACTDKASDQSTKGPSNELPPSGDGILGNEYKVIKGSVMISEDNPYLQPQPSGQDVIKESILDQAGTLEDSMAKDSDTHNQVEAVEQSADIYRASPPCGEIHATPNNKSGAKVESSVSNQRRNSASSRRGRKTTPKTLVRSEYALRSSGSSKAEKSNVKGKDAAPERGGSNVDNVADKKRRRKKSQIQRKSHDEFEKMRKQLRYWLHRITVEQSLIDAYSSEGWRGQSVEKLKPEMEIQRAKMDINRSKLSIRGLFQRILAVSAEGRFPDSLFDSDGQLDSEDIYCAKCGSKEVASNNDILLCDGPCDRGFHQRCLEPPLRTEDIPPGDEGWLCPACDCKIDCIGVLNDSMGLTLSIDDSWEKVFPEAEKTTGGALGDGLGLPSDDSDDTDYDPDGVNDVDNDSDADGGTDDAEGSNSSSDESDFSSASEDMAALNSGDQYDGLPSDDSEDEDFDPTNPDADDKAKHESSSSEFTSASENLGAVGGGDDGNCTVEGPPELSSEGDDVMPVSGKRQIERLDYKKLYDETYANTNSSSSDDEEWKDAVEPKKKDSEEDCSDASNRIGRGKRTRKNDKEKNLAKPKRRKYGSQERASKVPSDDGVSDNLAKSRHNTPRKSHKLTGVDEQLTPSSKSSPVLGHGGGGKKRQPHKKLGEAVSQRLYSFFKENQYPERSVKEKIAAELALTFQQVDKWFGNARWSLSNSSERQISSSQSGIKRKVGRPRKMGTESPNQPPGKTGIQSPNHKEGRVSTQSPTKASNVAQQNRGRYSRNNKLEIGESSGQETFISVSEREKNSLECTEVVQGLAAEGNNVIPNGSVRRNRRRSRA